MIRKIENDAMILANLILFLVQIFWQKKNTFIKSKSKNKNSLFLLAAIDKTLLLYLPRRTSTLIFYQESNKDMQNTLYF